MRSRVLVGLAALVLLTACGSDDVTSEHGTITPSAGPRPASTAKLEIIEPAPGSTITGGVVTVRLGLEGGRIVTEATRDLRPDEGHLHLTLNDKLQSMTFALEDRIQVEPGTHLLLAEFVAADHAPFNPRVIVTRTFVVPPA
ncbi:MAG: hypothetical protein M3203_01480 [Actinomycetota bacterium]|nr:hypothetical protein [Actinomycetota bacterium]